MYNNKWKAFTLVELIVVITILAILGTIAFISLQGYSQEAKNSKVTSDIRTLISAIETEATKANWFNIAGLVNTSSSVGTPVATWTFASGSDISTALYNVGTIDYPFLRQSEADFRDSEDNEYIAATIIDPNDTNNIFYQIAGQTKNQAGTYDAIVRWTYLKMSPWDIDGLIVGDWYPNGVTNFSVSMGWNWLY